NRAPATAEGAGGCQRRRRRGVTMTVDAVMAELQRLGTAQNVKVYRRHGAGDNLFGASFANLNVLKKKIKSNHELAQGLWATGNADARTLALMIADPDSLSAALADGWMKDIERARYYLLGDLFAGLIARSKLAESRMKKWMAEKREFHRQVGFDIVASRLKNGADLGDSDCKKILDVIRKDIHNSPNRSRHAMNMALIAVGIYRPSLRAVALKYADEIGEVTVDHGETGCKTPAARPYIERAAARARR
ncbi:MAG TPA: DNA alkylation repair protein, partial [candidate division Zixibacteria bacterium]|nr:DNA alkylation repair protein [candidate division Zixibacteria bacterium]